METMTRPSRSTHQPGAVPRGFAIARLLGMSHACFTFDSGIG